MASYWVTWYRCVNDDQAKLFVSHTAVYHYTSDTRLSFLPHFTRQWDWAAQKSTSVVKTCLRLHKVYTSWVKIVKK